MKLEEAGGRCFEDTSSVFEGPNKHLRQVSGRFELRTSRTQVRHVPLK
jgi:hypothetical protein